MWFEHFKYRYKSVFYPADKLILLVFVLFLQNLLFCTSLSATPAQAKTEANKADLNGNKIIMQIRWLHQFQFAGYYAAVHKGFYQQRGLDVEVIAGSPDRQPVTEVLAGRALYGEANSELLHSYLNGKPVVALAAIFQHSPSVLLSRLDSRIRSPQDLVAKRVMMVGDTGDVDFLSMLANEGIDPKSINIIPSSYNIQDLIDKKVDAFNAYLTNEPFYLKEKGIKSYKIEPLNYGIDFYSDILFTTKQEIENNPERVKAFTEASLLGWEYAMKHKQEVIDLIIKHYNPVKSRQHLEFEANAMENLILPKLVPMGNINPGRFTKMADSLVNFGFASADYSLDGFFYDPNPKVELATYFRTIIIISLLFVASLIFTGMVWIFNLRLKREIDRAHDAEHRLSASEAHHRNIIENLQDVYYRVDNRGTLVELSPSVKEVLGYSKEHTIGRNISEFYAPGYSRQDFLATLSKANGRLRNYQAKGLNHNGEERWLSVNSQYVLEENQQIGVEGTIRDITQNKQYEEKIIQLANSDALTNLANRRALFENLEHIISFNKRRSQLGGLLYIDLNAFKPVNDRYGHNMGDALLVMVADRLRSLLRAEDSIYRIGGDEFTILLPDLKCSRDDAINRCELIASKVNDLLSKPFKIKGHDIIIGASIGAVLFPEAELNADELMNKADTAMYQAKNNSNIFFIMSELTNNHIK